VCPSDLHVYNYELPNVPENYVHRIGRTARAGKDGAAIAFCAPAEMGELRDIQKVMKISIPVASGRPLEALDAPDAPQSGGGRGRGGPLARWPARRAGPGWGEMWRPAARAGEPGRAIR